MANSHHPNGSLYALPNELKLAIVEALILHRDPVPAVAIFNAESYIAVRALQKNTFDFKNSNHVNWIISRAQIQRLQQVRCVEFEAHWMKQTFTTGNGIPERNHFQGLQRLGQLTALKRLRLRFGALDESDEYGYRRWMAKTKATRDMYYRQVLSHVMRWLPILAQAVVVEVIIDTHARWTGPERWREARTIVTLRYVQSAPGQWRMIGDADEQEEQVAWQPNVHHEHARERKCGGCTAELITS